ncbi:hypothetical protein HN293_02855 [Acinetobacter baumannii]|nr:hypothetical protein [Acinetobacter baumannii]MBF6741974.1 hypothetical protein [Acinetobacter baumannii]MBF6881233.1 hypothetical protein [Acinetobacter baumannii]MBF6884600.1 hypothetical protein [Acinetobacter baumannii]MBH8488498.1 hypothetical protein [Acinetobacter baumannii]
MRYAARRKQDISVSTTPLEVVIPLEQPVKIYSAKELAAMPLSVMNAAIEAQERFYQLEELTHMGGASYCGSPSYGKWSQADSGKGKVPYALQNQQRIYSSKNYSSVGNARSCKIRSSH